jgi:CheY-like chemotaxis protein
MAANDLAPTKRILLAEDDRFLRKAAEAVLSRSGFTISTAQDGREALRLAASEQPDLILLDLILPMLQGFEVLKGLKSDPRTADIPVIILSSLGQEADVQHALHAGAVAHLIKASLSLKDLAQRLDGYLPTAAVATGSAA